jgi:hypothetical protein
MQYGKNFCQSSKKSQIKAKKSWDLETCSPFTSYLYSNHIWLVRHITKLMKQQMKHWLDKYFRTHYNSKICHRQYWTMKQRLTNGKDYFYVLLMCCLLLSWNRTMTKWIRQYLISSSYECELLHCTHNLTTKSFWCSVITIECALRMRQNVFLRWENFFPITTKYISTWDCCLKLACNEFWYTTWYWCIVSFL